MLLKEESSIVLSILSQCSQLDIVEQILSVIEDSTASVHKSVYEEAVSFYKENGRFPEFAYFVKTFPQISFGAKFNGDYSTDIITKFLSGLRREIASVKINECVLNGDFTKAAEVCSSVATLGKELEKFGVEDAVNEYNKLRGKTYSVFSGIKQIDDTINGFSYGHLSVIAAPPGCFKTTLAQNIAYYAIKNGFKVAFLSFELMKRNIYNNMLARHSAYLGTPIASEHMNKQILDENGEYQRFLDVADDFKKQQFDNNLFVVSPDDLTIWEPPFITRMLEQIDDKMGGLDIVILDYIQTCRSFAAVSGAKDSTTFVNNIISHLSFLSKTYKKKGLIVFLLSQVNRESMKELVKHEGNKGMALSSLAEFSSLERDASNVIFMYSNAADIQSRSIKIKVVKNRHGKVDEVPSMVSIDPSTGVIGEKDFGSGISLKAAITISQKLDNYDLESDFNLDS